jgi:hypothetical protein
VGEHRYEIRYANGKLAFARSLDKAKAKVLHETRQERAPTGLLPAEIWKLGLTDVVGRGEYVETIRAGKKSA